MDEGTEKARLLKEIDSLIQQITLLQQSMGSYPIVPTRDPYREENVRIELYLSEMTSRQGVLLTIAGLLTLLPLATQSLKYFLLWSFPFLIMAIVAYICSSKRINFVLEEDPEGFDAQEANKHLKVAFFNSARFHKIADVSICIFLVSFALNFYLITFSAPMNLCISIAILILSLIGGLWRFWFISQKSPTAMEYLALGGIVNENKIP